MNCKSSVVFYMHMVLFPPFYFIYLFFFFCKVKLNYENVKNNVHVSYRDQHPHTYKWINARNNLHKNICAENFSTPQKERSEIFHMKNKGYIFTIQLWTKLVALKLILRSLIFCVCHALISKPHVMLTSAFAFDSINSLCLY